MKKFGIIMLIFAIALAGALWGFSRKSAAAAAQGYTIAEQDAVRTVRCSGIVEAGEQKTVAVPSVCVIKEVYVQTGATVKKGDRLFRVDVQRTREQWLSTGKLTEKDYAAMAAEPTVCAPFDGIVLKLSVSEGEAAEPSRSGVLLADTSTLQIAVKVPEMRLKDVYIGQTAAVCGECFRKESYTGTVTFLSSAAATVLGKGTMIDATVTLSDGEADDSLRLGLTADVDLPAEVFSRCLLIPYDCLQNDDSGDFVLTAENGIAVRRAVTVAAELNDGAVIGDGLAAGDTLLRDAVRYTAGQAVTVK